MRRQILAGIVILASANLVFADDTIAPIKDVAPFSWSGAYIGAHIGYGWANTKVIDAYNVYPGGPPMVYDFGSHGIIPGLQAGYNWQDGAYVFGIEGDLGYLGLRGGAYPPPDEFGIPYDSRGSLKGGWYAGLSARFGVASGRTLYYAKAGGVYSSAKFRYVDDCVGTFEPPLYCGAGTFDASGKIGWGYQLGGGIEYALTDRWSIKAEYLFLDFPKHKMSARVMQGSAYLGEIKNVWPSVSSHTFKIGVNFKLGD